MKIGKYEVECLGDPHLSRRFETGVPLHRRGEREGLQLAQFADAILQTRADLHVTLGDLFDRFIVPPEIVLFAARTYMAAADENGGTTYVVLRGNHDVSRNTDKASSWDLFCALVASQPNIRTVDKCPVRMESLLFVPFDPFGYDNLEQHLTEPVDAVFSHFDIVDFGGSNVIPSKLFARHGITRVFNGHDHVARVERLDGIEIILTGSMQPFSHAEDKTATFYVTLTLAELAGRDVKNMNVRILLADGETLPTDIDCLSLTAKRVSSDEVVTVDTTTFDAIDLGDMLSTALGGLAVKDLIMGFYNDHKSVS